MRLHSQFLGAPDRGDLVASEISPMVVLFGAGASYGAGDTEPKPPPLGQDLFEALRRLYASTWGRIPAELATSFRDNFELGMEVVIERHGFEVGPLMQGMAKFFSVFSVSHTGENLYQRLLQHAQAKNYYNNLLLATLNYDCILETAASQVGLSVNYFGNLPSQSSTISVWKLHGSCNFKLTGIEATRGVQYSGTGIEFGGGIEVLQPREVRTYYSGNTALYPCMALYAKGKPVSVAPALLANAQRKWDEVVREARLVVVIGVNPNPDDAHVWAPLAETDAELLYIGGVKSFRNWQNEFRNNKKCTVLASTWSAVSNGLVERLASTV